VKLILEAVLEEVVSLTLIGLSGLVRIIAPFPKVEFVENPYKL
jgi:hypothetical protein